MSAKAFERELPVAARQLDARTAEYSLSNAARTKKVLLCVGRAGFSRYSGWSMNVLDEAVICENTVKKGGTAGFEFPRPFVPVRRQGAGAFCI